MSRSEDVQRELESLLRDEVGHLGGGSISEDAQRLLEQSSGAVFVTNVPGQELSLARNDSLPEGVSQAPEPDTSADNNQDVDNLEAELEQEIVESADDLGTFRMPPFARADVPPGGHLQTTDSILLGEDHSASQDIDLAIDTPKSLIDIVAGRAKEEENADVIVDKPTTTSGLAKAKRKGQPKQANAPQTIDARISSERHKGVRDRAIALQRAVRGDRNWLPEGMRPDSREEVSPDMPNLDMEAEPTDHLHVPPPNAQPHQPQYRSSMYSASGPKVGLGEVTSNAVPGLDSGQATGDYDAVVESVRKIATEYTSLFRELVDIIESHSAEIREVRSAMERASL